MALKEIAVDGCTIEPQGIVDISIPTATLTISSTPSTKSKAEGKGVYTTPLTFTVAGAGATGYDPGTVVTVGPATISATAIKCKDGSLAVMRVDDTSLSVPMTGTISGVPTPFVEVFKITDANQTKVKGE